MCLPRVTHCCLWGWDLRKGSRTIAIFSFGYSLANLMVMILLGILSGIKYGIWGIIGSILGLLFSLRLLDGVKHGKRDYIFAWLVYSMIDIVLNFAGSVILFVLGEYLAKEREKHDETSMEEIIYWTIGFCNLFFSGLWIYFWVVVYSYWKESIPRLDDDEVPIVMSRKIEFM